MTLNRREAEMGFGDEIPKRDLGIGVTRPLCGIQRDGNRKSHKPAAKRKKGV